MAAFFASASAVSLPLTLWCAGTHLVWIEIPLTALWKASMRYSVLWKASMRYSVLGRIS